ncbi:alkane 1-monooxygenase [Phaeovulum vinaykumarii]|uniref:Alkane 1-monooxygenase n=1 Tax=Phaeovulum vinaykumarii TaxID=407234 RepID=A0A1N7L0E0_9RHOB|nr:alkane 1-monooxygenase [Phaeovulum vinaykumarii]SIS67303.1 alkane 1-monooxygenase [Phaeovulum vinaykumarii]SOC00765.1 alkane 1-monooxygenase [Phaeovulum vinaykumarii]
MSTREEIRKPARALPFWLSLGMIPLAILGATQGGWTVILLPIYGWVAVTVLDAILGRNEDNPDPETPESDLFWYRLITMIWFPIQFITIFAMIWWVTHTDHLSTLETIVLFFGVGVISGTIGIVYSHELFHQRNRFEKWLGDLLLSTVLYSHFHSEHMLVHHPWVGTPRDTATARYNEGFHRFFWRVLKGCPVSAWKAEVLMLKRAGRGPFHWKNPFWRYAILQAFMLALAFNLGGWAGLGLFVFQAFIAVWQLELTNYVEHYGLTREHRGNGKYEHVLPRHSWNASHMASNWLLINLQRHSDHHYKPERRFPLLQTYTAEEAPQLPFGYPAMTTLAMIPPLWRRRMNPRVRAWRKKYYPEIADWHDYNKGNHPMPQGSV